LPRGLAAARDEMSHAVEFDFAIVNDEFEQALQDLRAVVRLHTPLPLAAHPHLVSR
jgi:guanylate kinase